MRKPYFGITGITMIEEAQQILKFVVLPENRLIMIGVLVGLKTLHGKKK
ncbi:MAG: hypothetical protein QMD50_02720 [Patescibacteria group bacterium]|nr:hypothetical protein [Patescibacteria group bacterium]